jgi:hypothetical protein
MEANKAAKKKRQKVALLATGCSYCGCGSCPMNIWGNNRYYKIPAHRATRKLHLHIEKNQPLLVLEETGRYHWDSGREVDKFWRIVE